MLTSTERGVSLVELMIALTVGTVVILTGMHFFVRQVDLHTRQEKIVRMQQQTRQALDIMMREIRMAGYDPSQSAGAGVGLATHNTIAFSADLDGDGDTQDTGESITYALFDEDDDGVQELGRTADSDKPEVVARDIVGLNYVYTLADGSSSNAPSDPSQIRRVDVFLTGKTDQVVHDQYQTWMISGSETLRNLAFKDEK